LGSSPPISSAKQIDLGLAQTITNQYASIFSTPRLNSISSKLVGKYRTSGAVNPKQSLYLSRVNDLTEIKERMRNPINDEELDLYDADAARTMIEGGKIARRKKKNQKKYKGSKRSKSPSKRKSR